jgi:hypothetical protein
VEVNRRPLFVESEHFRVNGITLHHAVKVAGFLRFLRHLGTLGQVGISKGTADQIT